MSHRLHRIVDQRRIGLAASIGIFAMVAPASKASDAGAYTGYHVASTTALSGKVPRWDHLSVDSANRNLFIGNRASGLTVVNIDTGVVTTVPETTGAAGAAVAADLGLGLSDRGREHDVTVFDLKTLAVKGHIPMATELDGVFYDPATKMGYTNNGDSGSITFFDPVTLKAGKTVDLGTKKPEFSDVDGQGRAFVALQDKNAIAVVDTRTQKLEATWPVDCDAPTGLMYEPSSRRLFIPCRGPKPVMAIVDATSGKTISTLPIGVGADAVAFYTAQKLVLVSNGGSATLQVFKQGSGADYSLVETVSTRYGARTMALDTKTGKAFTVFAETTVPAAPVDGKRSRPKTVPGSFQLLTLEYGAIE